MIRRATVLGFNRLPTTRIVATSAALNAAIWRTGAIALRIADDEVYVLPPVVSVDLTDPHAIVVPDAGFAGAWLPANEALNLLERQCEWELPTQRPAFAQGMIAGIAAKVWFETDRILIIVPAPFVAEFEERTA
jgi:hypothetical protein